MSVLAYGVCEVCGKKVILVQKVDGSCWSHLGYVVKAHKIIPQEIKARE